MALKFYTKRFKTKSQKGLGANSYVFISYRGANGWGGGGLFAPPILNRVNFDLIITAFFTFLVKRDYFGQGNVIAFFEKFSKKL